MIGNVPAFYMFACLLCRWNTSFKIVSVLRMYWHSARRTCVLSRAVTSWKIDHRLRYGLLETSDQLMGWRRAPSCCNQFSSFGMCRKVRIRLWNVEDKFPDLRKEPSLWFWRIKQMTERGCDWRFQEDCKVTGYMEVFLHIFRNFAERRKEH